MTTVRPEVYRHDAARYPGAPCSHCGTKLRMYQATVWVHPYCCKPEHRVKRKASAGGSTSIICRTCARTLGLLNEAAAPGERATGAAGQSE